MTARMGRVGIAAALLYVGVALATRQLSSRPVLPLFDGFAPPTPYAWVNPPPDRATDNVAPLPAEREFPLDAEGSASANASTDDAQAIVGLDKGSVPPHLPDTAVSVRLTPIDAGVLGPLPSGLRVVSNAYRVALHYVPSQTPLNELAVKGTMALTAAEEGDRLLYSPDGRSWQEVPFRRFGQDHGVFTELRTVGWFVVAASSGRAPSAEGRSDVVRTVLLAVVALVPIVGAVLVLRMPSPVAGRPPARRGPSPGRQTGTRPERRKGRK